MATLSPPAATEGSCAYCNAAVTFDGDVFIDGSGGDCCWGSDVDNVNENGQHRVFDPVAGFTGVCVAYVPDAGACGRCFHSASAHQRA